MEILLWLLVLEAVVLVLVVPTTFTVKINLSLAKEKAIFALKFLGIMPIIFKIEKKNDWFRISINGKIVGNNKRQNNNVKKKRKLGVSYLELLKEIVRFVEKIDTLLIVGGKSAFSTACNCILATNILSAFGAKSGKSLIIPDYEHEAFILDVEIKWRVSLIDILRVAGKYGNQRNFKTYNRQFERSHQH